MLLQCQLVDLLNELLNQEARLRKGGNQAVYYCPNCNHYKRKLEFNLETGQWHCWTCDIKGTYLGSFLTKVKASRSYRDRLLKLTGDIRLARKEKKKTIYADVVLPEEFLPLTTPRHGFEYKNAVAYLRRRGIIEEDILRYNIGYCEKGDYAKHIIIPSYDATGALNFFMGRRYYDEGNPPHKKPYASMNIVGFELFVNYNEPLVLCEGIFDAIAIRNNAIPLFGKYPSKLLLERMIVNKVKQVIIVLDNDARDDAVKNYELITKRVPRIEVHIVRLSGKDPSKLGFAKVHPIIRNSQEFDFADLMSHKVGL